MEPVWSLSRHPLTRVAYGLDGLSQWLTRHAGRRLTILVDAAVADGEAEARVRERAAWADRDTERIVLSGPGDLASVTRLAADLVDREFVVAIGGGSLLDQAKLAVLLGSDPAVGDRLTVRQRSGLVLLSADSAPRVPLVAVPTTVGTGSELSGAVCLSTPEGKRLVLGNGLQPEVAVYDAVATRTLPGDLLAEGVLEVLFRLAGMYAGDHRELPTEDAFAETLLRRLVRLGDEVAAARADGTAPGDALRLEIAKLSGLSHQPWLNLGRDPCACKGWYLANELSTALGVRKMTAAAALLPPLWRRITRPDLRWGSAPRLARLWRAVSAARTVPGPVDDPAAGIDALLDDWGIRRSLDAPPERVAEVARATVRAWGQGLPTLGALTLADVHEVMAEAVGAPALATR
ncbi:daptide-type RiPP biosynthesis dehydogenase [Streptomyces misionensis]|uniref:daptide-type RiPP biosynthesis dehydogenase n=1 Tax=Streptomyces misionensis TaxID=67331 RepID=UPI0033DFBBBA